MPIGRPIAHTDVYILDGDMKPVADGEVGQLCVGGDGLSLGYLNRPELNAEKFVPNPFGGRARRAALSDERSGAATSRRKHRVPRP